MNEGKIPRNLIGVMIIAVEEDNVLRLLDVLFEPELPREGFAALADYFAHDGVNLDSWRNSVRRRAPGLFPSTLRCTGCERVSAMPRPS